MKIMIPMSIKRLKRNEKKSISQSIRLCILVLGLLSQVYTSQAQDETSGSYEVIIGTIENLESSKDPKCHATANRLENFMFGTPLTDEARDFRIDLQKKLVRHIWTQATSISETDEITINAINRISNDLIKFQIRNEEWYLGLEDGTTISINKRDYDHYSSIAYSLRAILAIQQEDLFGKRQLLHMNQQAVNHLKFIIDVISIGILKSADFEARQNNSYEISVSDLRVAWKLMSNVVLTEEHIIVNDQPSDYELTLKVITQKLASYEQYNQLSQKVFLRNVQVFFAQVPWPSDSIQSTALTSTFQSTLVFFTSKLIEDAHKLAVDNNRQFISQEDVRKSLLKLLPHSVNEFEDVTFFDRLGRSGHKRIEAYDLDAFRDSGIHWNYLEAGIRQSIQNLSLEPNPHALEVLVEGIAQMGVLLWRVAGEFANEEQSNVLYERHLHSAFDKIKNLSNEANATPINSRDENIRRGADLTVSSDNGILFEDVTDRSGIEFEHRTSDWLNRQIRSYVVKEEENLARLAIPPAFGGGGVAAEDINEDGYADILILSGQGSKIFKNNGDKSFTDITKSSGIDWTREDGTKGEPRQPIIADFDNDGHKDIFMSYVNDLHKIYKGNGDGTFIDFSEESNLGGKELIGGPCTALDYDRDGLLDIYIGYFGNYMKGELPTLKRHNVNGSPNKLFRNLGNFKFKDVTDKSGLDNKGWTQAVGHADINNDGWQDIIVGNDFGVNGYYINNMDGSFTDKSEALGVDKPSYTMNIGFTDLNADDYPDFYISNIVVMEKDDKYTAPTADTKMHFNPEVLANMRVVEANDLFMSQQKDSIYYKQSKSIGRGYSSTGWAWDADFFDYDNDGDEDLYCLNGMNQYSVYSSENTYYTSPEGEDLDIVLATSQSGKNVFFENNDGFLQNRSSGSGLDLDYTSRSAAYLDYDNDGDLDVILNNYNGAAYMFENKSEKFGNNWISIDLVNYADGKIKTLVGTKIRITTPDGKSVWRQVSSTTGYLSGHPNRIHVGLGHSKKCEIQITWPDGDRQSLITEDLNKLLELTRS